MSRTLLANNSNLAEIQLEKPSSLDRSIGIQLRKERQRRSMTLLDVSNCLGVSYQQVQKYEQAKSRIAASTLYRLTEFYEMDIGNFFDKVAVEAATFNKRRTPIKKDFGINILIVEANPADEVITRNALRDIEDLNILCVRDGEQVLQVLKYKSLCPDFPRPNIVFLDVYIPKRNGMEVLKELKREEDTKDIPVIIMTNNVSSELTARAYKLGAAGYILKSTNYTSFKENIINCVRYWTKTVINPNQDIA